ncbi:MAG: hypothetical protein IJN63_03205 [Clostridia bacterium]|nr:hypothetical protein [Clostridia bacterium]
MEYGICDKERLLSDDYGYDLPLTRDELLPLLQLLEEKIEAVDEDIRDLAREAVRVTAELEAIRDKLTNLKEYY